MVFQYRKRYGLHAIRRKLGWAPLESSFQYRKRYGLHAISYSFPRRCAASWFQYRKRYGLHAMTVENRLRAQCRSFNTASGMDCMQFVREASKRADCIVSIPQAVWIACNRGIYHDLYRRGSRFNTASGMDCMQFLSPSFTRERFSVSIPQAVWIACNWSTRNTKSPLLAFQYRKRYGLHAIIV